MFKNLVTIVEVFGDHVLSLIGVKPMHNHHTMVAADRVIGRKYCWCPGSCIGHRLAAQTSYDGLRAVRAVSDQFHESARGCRSISSKYLNSGDLQIWNHSTITF